MASGYPPPSAPQYHLLVDTWCWKTFLAPLNVSGVKAQPSGRTTVVKTEPSGVDKSLVQRFKENLQFQHLEKKHEKDVMVSNAKEDLASLLKPFTDFKVLETKWKNYKSALEIKSDCESSGSTWTITKLERYIKRQDIIFVQPEVRFDMTGEELQMICERVDLSVQVICGRQSPPATVANLGQLQHHSTTEPDTKMILDAILQPLCVSKGLTVRSGQTIKCSDLPTNKYDFIMYYNDKPIGVVEAKRRGSLNDQSVPHLLLQLLLLSGEEPNRFYFGFLSDGYQYIFAGVTREKVVFFQTNDKLLEITAVKSHKDLKSLVGKISWLIDLAIQTR